MDIFIKFAISLGGAALSLIFQDNDVAIWYLIAVIVLDYITGIIKGAYQKKLSSEYGIKGILKKVGFLIVVALATIIDYISGLNNAFRLMVIYFLVANDGLSIIENLGEIGVPIPKKLKSMILSIRDDAEEIKVVEKITEISTEISTVVENHEGMQHD